MREIKFRAWIPPVTDEGRTLPGEMVYDLQHSVVRSVRTQTREVPEILGFEHTTQGIYELNERLRSYCDRLMQFTGLHDKNGKEIWEGDVVRGKRWGFRGLKQVQESIREVEWGDGRWQAVNGSHGSSLTSQDVVIHDIEVIGNIYENPDLIK